MRPRMLPPPRYRNFKPNRKAFHNARALWYFFSTGKVLKGSIRQQDRIVNSLARKHRGTEKMQMKNLFMLAAVCEMVSYAR